MNATLEIKDPKEFGYDIWQTADCEHWDAEKWTESLNTLINGLKEIYKHSEDRLDDLDLYTIGDTINLLESINVKVKRR